MRLAFALAAFRPMLLLMDGNSWDGIMGVLTSAISASTISSVIVSVGTAAVAIVFFWWAERSKSKCKTHNSPLDYHAGTRRRP